MLRPMEPAPAGVTGVRWYRAVVGSDGGVVWLRVADAPLPGTLLDTSDTADLGEQLTTEHHYPPPGCVQGVALVGNSQVLVWNGRQLYASHPRTPWAFDVDLITGSLQYEVVGAIGVVGRLEGADTFEAHVMTTGTPYRVTVAGEGKLVLDVRQVQEHLPCINPRSVCDMHGRSGYASQFGFIRLSGEGVENITDGWMTEHEWMALSPWTATAAYWHERLVLGWSDRNGVCFVLAPDDGARPRTMSEFTPRVQAWYTRPDVPLHLAHGGEVHRWGAGAPLQWLWESDITVTAQLWHPTAVKVATEQAWRWTDEAEPALAFQRWVADDHEPEAFFTANPQWRHLQAQLLPSAGVRVAVMRHGRSVWYGWVNTLRPERLPRVTRGTEWSIRLSGYSDVREVHLQATIRDMVKDGGE